MAAFNKPEALFFDLTARAYKEDVDTTAHLRDQGYYQDELRKQLLKESSGKTLLLSAISLQGEMNDYFVRRIEGIKNPEDVRADSHGALASRIFRNAKHVQYQNAPPRKFPNDFLDRLDLSDMTVEELLVAEAWALEHIDDALYQFGLGGPPNSEGSPSYLVDVTEAFERVIKAYGPPKSEARRLIR